MTLLRALLVLLLLTLPASASNRFWVGGTGTWDNSTTTHWSATTGGAGGASTPGFLDSVFFDASSGGGTVTINVGGGVNVGGLDMSAAAAMTLAGSGSTSDIGMLAGGNIILGTNVTYTITGKLSSSSPMTLTSNGKTWSGTVEVLGGLTLVDDASITGAIAVTAGTLNAANKNITSASTITTSGTLTMGSGTWTCSTFTYTTGTITRGTSTIKITGNGVTFAGGGQTYGNLWIAHAAQAGTVAITGANTFADIKDDGTVAHIILFPASTTTTATSVHITGQPAQLISINSSTNTVQATLNVTGGLVAPDYVSIKDSLATGGAIFDAGANATNGGNNTGWLFNVPLPIATFSQPPI